MKSCRPSLVALALITTVLLASSAVGQQRPCMPLAGTILANYDYTQAAWVGRVYLQFDDNPPIVAALKDVNDGYKDQPARGLAGNEILTFSVGASDSFVMKGHFVAMPGNTPNWWNFSEVGKIVPEEGLGIFAGMTGNMSIHGPVIDDTWFSQITGSVCGAP